MASINFKQLLASINPEDLEPEPQNKKITPGVYRAQVVSAKHGYSRSGRDMYTVSLVIMGGEFEGRFVRWYLTVVQEHPHLLHEFFANMLKVGVSTVDFATATSHYDIVRRIVLTGATLDVVLQGGRGEFLDVTHVRRVTTA
jgi:hypothetical protein